MEGILNRLWPRAFNWRVLDKRQFRMYIVMHVAAIVSLFYLPSYWFAWLVLTHFLVNGVGVSDGFHRLFTHRSYTAQRWVGRLLAFLGTFALQGGILHWVATHRAHHSSEGKRGDPHSIHKGRWWSHIWWAVHKGPNGFRYKTVGKLAHDVAQDPFMVFLDKYILFINGGTFLLVFFMMGIEFALLLFPLRTVVGWHATFFVNSMAHDVRKSRDGLPSAENVLWIAILAFGEGNHKNHHEKPSSPNFSWRWYEIDMGYWVIKMFHQLKLAHWRAERDL